MSCLLRRRDSEQCRSHHQKLSLKYNGDIDSIISNLGAKIMKEQENNSIDPMTVAVSVQQEGGDSKVNSPSLAISESKKYNPATGLNNNINYIDGYHISTEFSEEINIFIDFGQADFWWPPFTSTHSLFFRIIIFVPMPSAKKIASKFLFEIDCFGQRDTKFVLESKRKIFSLFFFFFEYPWETQCFGKQS